MKRFLVLALLAGATLAHAQTKKELAQKIVQLELPSIEALARDLTQQPAVVMMQEADRVLRTQVPEDKRAGISAAANAAAKKYMDDTFPLLRERAVKLAPAAFGGPLEEKLSEDELKQVIAWMESPTSRKFQSTTDAGKAAFVQALVAEARPLVDPKLAALDQALRAAFSASAPAAGAAASAPKARAAAPAKPASK